jgi:hypothetical protein
VQHDRGVDTFQLVKDVMDIHRFFQRW